VFSLGDKMGGPTLKEQILKAYLNCTAGYCLLGKDMLLQRMEDMLHDEDGIQEAENQEAEDDAEMMEAMMSRLLSAMDGLLEGAKQMIELRRLPPVPVAKCSQLPLIFEAFMMNDPKRFQRNLRVSPETFRQLERKLSDHTVFHPREGVVPQLPVRYQLAIALFRFGHEGSACGVEQIAQWAGVSAGMVNKATRRVMIAALSYHDEAIRWVTPEEKEEAKTWVEGRSCRAWRGGYCMVDGTLVPLFEKPHHFGEGYFDRKSNYSLNVQLITLPNLRIIDYVVGHTGSKHDSSAFKDSRTAQDHDELFPQGEWIWADSAYSLESWTTAPYKKPLSEKANNKTFNYFVSRVRVRSEHAVGYLKGRFGSLRGLRQQILNERAHHLALAWVKTCMVLHMLCWKIETQLDEEENIQRLIDEGVTAEREAQRRARDSRMRLGLPVEDEEEDFADFWETLDVEEAERLEMEELSQRQRRLGRPGARLTAGQKKRIELRERLFESGVVHRRGN
jgi:hypothetical protein